MTPEDILQSKNMPEKHKKPINAFVDGWVITTSKNGKSHIRAMKPEEILRSKNMSEK